LEQADSTSTERIKKRDRPVTKGQKAQFFPNINATTLNQPVQNVVHGNVPTVSEAVDYERRNLRPFSYADELHGPASQATR
jgi:hypothetical protein